MEGFKAFLLSRHVMNDKTAGFYLFWVTQFYGYCGKRPGDTVATEDIEQYLSSVNFESITKNTITDKDKFRNELKQIHEESIALSSEELYSGRMAMAVPVFKNDGQVVAAIAQPIPTIRFDQEKEKNVRQALHNASKELSHKLGYW